MIDRAHVDRLHGEIWAQLATSGDWWTGAQRLAVATQVRAATQCGLCIDRLAALSPNSVPGHHGRSGVAPTDDATGGVPNDAILNEEAVEVVHRVVTDPARLTRTWADARIAALGEGPYAELVAVAAIVVALDAYRFAVGDQATSLPSATSGDEPAGDVPARVRPESVGDVGAWISMTTKKSMANVSRALSLLPRTQTTWARLVTDSYSRGPEMLALEWTRAISRPQVELIAAKISELNQCFY